MICRLWTPRARKSNENLCFTSWPFHLRKHSVWKSQQKRWQIRFAALLEQHVRPPQFCLSEPAGHGPIFCMPGGCQWMRADSRCVLPGVAAKLPDLPRPGKHRKSELENGWFRSWIYPWKMVDLSIVYWCLLYVYQAGYGIGIAGGILQSSNSKWEVYASTSVLRAWGTSTTWWDREDRGYRGICHFNWLMLISFWSHPIFHQSQGFCWTLPLRKTPWMRRLVTKLFHLLHHLRELILCRTNQFGYGSIPMKIPFLVEWTPILTQLFWCELQGYKVLTHCHLIV